MGDTVNVIAVDDYFRRLDEALATAGLSTAPEPAGDLAAIVGHAGLAADRSGDAETIVVPRPAPVAADASPVEADRAGEASKLVDAFSALLAAEEGDGGVTIAGPVEMDGAPAPRAGRSSGRLDTRRPRRSNPPPKRCVASGR